MEVAKKENKRTFQGEVVADGMQKTIVVEFKRVFKHPRTGKVIRTKKKYKVHDEDERAKVGNIVEFYEGRPVSKTKYMYLSRVVS